MLRSTKDILFICEALEATSTIKQDGAAGLPLSEGN